MTKLSPPEKHGDLIVGGKPAYSYVPEFMSEHECIEFEFATYNEYENRYGKDEVEKIDNLRDVYGKSFAERIYTRRYKQFAERKLNELEKEHIDIINRIKKLKHFIENPQPTHPDNLS